MDSLALDFLDRVAERRKQRIEDAKQLVSSWFQRDAKHKRKQRFYAPHVRITNAGSDSESVSIYWTRRWPINNWEGVTVQSRTRGAGVLKVASKYIAGNKRGPAYPATKFQDAGEDELADILFVESSLSLIRTELAFLGRLRRSIFGFYAGHSPSEPAAPIEDQSLPEW